MTRTYPIQHLTREAFAPYGAILGHYQEQDGYEIVAAIESTGWLWALKTFHNQDPRAHRLPSRHPGIVRTRLGHIGPRRRPTR